MYLFFCPQFLPFFYLSFNSFLGKWDLDYKWSFNTEHYLKVQQVKIFFDVLRCNTAVYYSVVS